MATFAVAFVTGIAECPQCISARLESRIDSVAYLQPLRAVDTHYDWLFCELHKSGEEVLVVECGNVFLGQVGRCVKHVDLEPCG